MISRSSQESDRAGPVDAPGPHAAGPLLAPDEPPAVASRRLDGASPFLLACDHAGRAVPRRLGRLGLPDAEFDRHIAWDIGIAAVSRLLSEKLDAALIEQPYSRLVIDCNRPPHVAGSIPVVSEVTEIPGNVGLSEAEKAERVDLVFRPYHDALAAALDARKEAGRPTVLIAMHSFTPRYRGDARPWHIGTLYGRDGRLAASLRPLLAAEAGLVVGDNEPYAVGSDTDWTIPVHGEARGIPVLGLEIRQDLITHEDGQALWAERLASLLPARPGETCGTPMDNVEILRRFERHEDGSWTCHEETEIATTDGPIRIPRGRTVHYGERIGHLDLAEYLEQLGAQFGS